MIAKEIFNLTSSDKANGTPVQDGVEFEVSKQVDCIGLRCPRPQLLTKQALKAVSAGQVIKVLVDCESSVEGVEQILSYLSATLQDVVACDGGWAMYIRHD